MAFFKEHDLDDDLLNVLEGQQFEAFVEGWIEGRRAAGVDEGCSMLERRVTAAEAYNAQHGTDHLGDMLRRIAGREASAK